MSRRALLALLVGLSAAAVFLWQCRQDGRPTGPRRSGERAPNIVLIVVDTLRADALTGPRGEPRRMPRMHALAQRGVLFPNAVAPAPWTNPSMASLLTGRLPREHGVERMVVGAPQLGAVTTWAQALAARGYQTSAYTGGPWSWDARGSMLKGFETGKTAYHLRESLDALETWSRGLDRGRPWFLLLHTFEAHDPYGEEDHPLGRVRPPPRPGFDPAQVDEPWEVARSFLMSRTEREMLHVRMGERFMPTVVRYLWSGYRAEPRPDLAAELKADYEAGVTWVDGLLGEATDFLRERGLLDGSVLIVTGDHGEAFGEHGYLEHGRQCFDEVVRVPLVLVGPPPLPAGRVVTATVSLLDALPTALDLGGQSVPPGMRGRSLLPVIDGREGGRAALTQERVDFVVSQEDVELALRSVRTDRWKVILTWNVRTGALTAQAYDLVADPDEQHDLAGGRGTLAGLVFDATLEAGLEETLRDLATDGAPPLPR